MKRRGLVTCLEIFVANFNILANISNSKWKEIGLIYNVHFAECGDGWREKAYCCHLQGAVCYTVLYCAM